MQRSMTALILTATAAVPAGAAWAATHTTAHPAAAAAAKATPTPTHKSTKKTTKATTRKFAGPSEDMQWGPVQVTIAVKNKKITDVQATTPTERMRSQFINQQAVPMLRQEVLQAQSANIDLIGGATMTSEAYDTSLQAAINTAHKAHAI